MRALSIRQPYAELILRGMKTIEYRSRATSIIGERFWIYASKSQAAGGGQRAAGDALARSGVITSDNLSAASAPPPWMIELAEGLKLFGGVELPRGVIVGSAVIERCVAHAARTSMYEWHLTDVRRADDLRAPTRHPQPAWFRPF